MTHDGLLADSGRCHRQENVIDRKMSQKGLLDKDCFIGWCVIAVGHPRLCDFAYTSYILQTGEGYITSHELVLSLLHALEMTINAETFCWQDRVLSPLLAGPCVGVSLSTSLTVNIT